MNLKVYINDCPICITKVEDVGVVTHCGHIFHEKCFDKYISHEKSKNGENESNNKYVNKKINCPICFKNIRSYSPKSSKIYSEKEIDDIMNEKFIEKLIEEFDITEKEAIEVLEINSGSYFLAINDLID